MNKIKVLLVEPGMDPRLAMVEDTLEGFTKALGGSVSLGCFLPQRVMLVCREDSGSLPVNRVDPASGLTFHGTFLLCGFEDVSFISLTPEQQETFQRHFAIAGDAGRTRE